MPTRRLAAIMFADIVGYTAMMQRDEQVGLTKVKRFSEVMEAEVQAHQGEVLQFLGDGCLCMFHSAVEALHAARAIQEQLKSSPQVPLRIGIHIGDIVVQEGNVYGDGVNLASRVESMGVPGSILVTERVIHDVRSHPEFLMASLGKFQFKNVDKSLEVFALANDGFPVPRKKEIQGKLAPARSRFPVKWLAVALIGVVSIIAIWALIPQKTTPSPISANSVAVLPFKNVNKDEEGDFFSDGMMEDILTHLSRIGKLKVISRTSAMHYKGSTQKLPEIAQELGVAHIVEGSVRIYGQKARITVQLIRAADDLPIWAENYDRELADIFSVQSEVAQKIVQALEVNISAAESKSLETAFSPNKEAYQLFLKGKRAADDRSRAGLAQSVNQLKAAIALDSTFSDAYANLAFSVFNQGRYRYVPEDSSDAAAIRLAETALEYDSQNTLAFCVLGGVAQVNGRLEKAKSLFDQALQISPNNPFPHHALGQYYAAIGEFEKEVIHREKVLSLDPLIRVYHRNYIESLIRLGQTALAKQRLAKAEALFPEDGTRFIQYRGLIHVREKNYEAAIPFFEQIINKQTELRSTLGFCYARTGKSVKAEALLDKIRQSEATPHLGLAIVYAGLRQWDHCLTQISLELDHQKNKQLALLALRAELTYEIYFEELKGDRRFMAILEKLNASLS